MLHSVEEDVEGDQGLAGYFSGEVADVSQKGGNDDCVVVEDVRHEVFREIAESVDGCSFYLRRGVGQAARDQHIHNGVLQVLFHPLSAALADGAQDKEASVDLVGVFGFDEIDCGLEENWVYLLGLDSDRQGFDEPKGDFLHELASLFIFVLSMAVRLRAGPADSLDDFLEQSISARQLLACKVSKREEVVAASSPHLVGHLLIADDLLADPHSHVIGHADLPLHHHGQHFNSDDAHFLGPVGALPDLDELDGEGRVDVLRFNNRNNALYGLFRQLVVEEGVEKVGVKTGWWLEVIEDAVEQYESSSGVGRRLDGLVQKLLELNPVLYLNNREKNADQRGNTSLHKKVSLLGVLLQQKRSKLLLLLNAEPLVQVHKVALEEYGGHLPVRHFRRVDEDEGEDADGDLVLGIGLEQASGLLNLLVVSGEGGLDELEDLFGSERIEIDVGLHRLLKYYNTILSLYFIKII